MKKMLAVLLMFPFGILMVLLPAMRKAITSSAEASTTPSIQSDITGKVEKIELVQNKPLVDCKTGEPINAPFPHFVATLDNPATIVFNDGLGDKRVYHSRQIVFPLLWGDSRAARLTFSWMYDKKTRQYDPAIVAAVCFSQNMPVPVVNDFGPRYK